MAHSVLVAENAQTGIAEACAYISNILCEPSAVITLLDKLDEFIDAVAMLPDLHPLCIDERLAGKGIRKALINGYVALFVHDETSVTVIAFFHQTQDHAKLV